MAYVFEIRMGTGKNYMASGIAKKNCNFAEKDQNDNTVVHAGIAGLSKRQDL